MKLQIDWSGLISPLEACEASEKVRTIEGRVLVECPGIPEKIGNVYIPDSNSDIRPDVGRVIASRPFPGKARIWKGSFPRVGDAVIMSPKDGIWLEGLELGSYKPKNRVKAFGSYCEFKGQPLRCHPCQSIVAIRDESMELGIRPTLDNVLLRLHEANGRYGQLYLPDTAHNPTGTATVLAVGDMVQDVKVGDEVVYDYRSLAETGLEFELSGEQYKNCALCAELAIIAVAQAA